MISIKAVSIKEIKTTSQISEKPIDVTKPAESKSHRHCFFFADIDSSGYAKKATIRCYDGIISVTYYNGVTNVNFRFGSETFTGSHVLQIYGFGGTHNWAGTVTNKDIAFAGFTLVCILCKDSKDSIQSILDGGSTSHIQPNNRVTTPNEGSLTSITTDPTVATNPIATTNPVIAKFFGTISNQMSSYGNSVETTPFTTPNAQLNPSTASNDAVQTEPVDVSDILNAVNEEQEASNY